MFSIFMYILSWGVGKGEGNRRGAAGIRLEGGRRESLLTNQDEVSQSGRKESLMIENKQENFLSQIELS